MRNKSDKRKKNKPHFKNMTIGSELRLGLRNTFNLPTKFILLLIVYVFISSAVLAQYASTKEAVHQSDITGMSMYFTLATPDRVIVTKHDKTAFTDDEIAQLQNTDNVKQLVRNDLGLDNGIMLESDEEDISGPVYPVEMLNDKKLTYGRMPEKDNEIAIGVDETSMAYDAFKSSGKKYIGKSYYANVSASNIPVEGRISAEKLKIVGIKVDDRFKGNNDIGSSKMYVSEKIADKLLIKTVAASSETTANYNGIKSKSKGEQKIFSSPSVSKGKAYIFEDDAANYPDEAAVGKKVSVSIKNTHFDTAADFTVSNVVTSKNIEYLLGSDGLTADNYDECSGRIYISESDFKNMFDKGDFQVSIFMKDETQFANMKTELNKAGFDTLAVKDTLTDMSGGLAFVIKMLQIVLLIIMFIVLFFIGYTVIRLIMRSRNPYYSTLRILGASKRNTDRILRVELLFMMIIAYGLDMLFLYLVKTRVIHLKPVLDRMRFLEPVDFALLFLTLMLMSLFIARRYSRKIFTKSAMNVFRQED